MKKRNAMQKFLKSDVVDLLRTGLDVNAYRKADELLIEKNRAACYEFVDQFCDCIQKNLDTMQKQRECPEECREAVSSLIYAAARFADLPELRGLRTLFTEKYGTSLDLFLNKEFAQKLRADSPTKEMKVQLMQDISEEFSLHWNPKPLEQNLFKPPPPKQDDSDDFRYSMPKGNERISNSPRQNRNADSKIKYRLYSSSEDDVNGTSKTFITDLDVSESETSSSSDGISSEDDSKKKPRSYRSIPAPYSRPGGQALSQKPSSVAQDRPSSKQDDTKPKPRSVRRRPSNLQSGIENSSNVEEITRKSSDEEEEKIDSRDRGKEAVRSRRTRSAETFGMSSSSMSTDNVARRGHARTQSLQPDRLSSHVHPKLPDYDDLAAQLAALTGR